MKSIKISDETYAELFRIAGEIQAETKSPVSVDETLKRILKAKKPVKISDLAGTLDLSDSEMAKINASLHKRWKAWKPSA